MMGASYGKSEAASFSVHMSSVSGSIMYLIFTTLTNLVTIGIVIVETYFFIYHINSPDLMFKGLCEYIGGSPSW